MGRRRVQLAAGARVQLAAGGGMGGVVPPPSHPEPRGDCVCGRVGGCVWLGRPCRDPTSQASGLRRRPDADERASVGNPPPHIIPYPPIPHHPPSSPPPGIIRDPPGSPMIPRAPPWRRGLGGGGCPGGRREMAGRGTGGGRGYRHVQAGLGPSSGCACAVLRK